MSIEYLRATFGGRVGSIGRFCPDVAFTLEPFEPPSKESDLTTAISAATSRENRAPLVGFNINGLMYNGGYTGKNMFQLRLNYHEFAIALAQAILEKTDANILLIPHNYAAPGAPNNDAAACQEVYKALAGNGNRRIFMLRDKYSAGQLKWIIGRCDVFIGSRLHSCIAGLSQGIKTIGIAYSRKFIGLFGSLGCTDWIVDARRTGSEAAIEEVLALLKAPHVNRLDQKEAVKLVQKEIFGTFTAIFTA